MACAITVSEPVYEDSYISLSQTEVSVYAYKTLQLAAAVYKNDGTKSSTTVVWSSNNGNIATVDENGLVTGMAEGSTVIRAATADGKIKASCKITILFIHVTEVTITDSDETNVGMTKTAGDSWWFTVVVEPENASNPKVSWYSTNPKVAIDENGVVTTPTDLDSSITVRFYAAAEDGGIQSKLSVNYTVLPSGINSAITLPMSEITLKTGESYEISALVNASVYYLIWASDDNSVAEVKRKATKTATIAAGSPGMATITVKISGTESWASCTVTVVGEEENNEGGEENSAE